MRKLVLLVVPFFVLPITTHAAEGMWTMDNLPRAAMQRELGFAPDDRWAERVQRSSVRLAGGCSGSFVSPDGLVLTNHHCIWSCVEQLSTAEENLMQTGFLARERGAERQCPNVELNQLLEITDVTERVNAATEGRTGAALGEAQRAEMGRIEQECVGDDATRRCDVVTLYHGGRYHLYRYKRFDDVRLVWSPELKSSFFGGDPDNFNFPRFVLDASFLRAYENGQPARTPDHFRWNARGAADGEAVFVTGHPGSTQRLLTVAQLEFQRDVAVLDRLVFLAEYRGMLNQYAAGGGEQARYAQSDILGVENTYKVLRGRMAALQDPALFAAKMRDEEALRAWVAADDARVAEFGGAWDAITEAQAAHRELYQQHSLIELGRAFNSRYFTIARHLLRAGDERAKPNDQRLREYRETALQSLSRSVLSPAPIHADYEQVKLAWSLTKLREIFGTDDPFVRAVLGDDGPNELARKLVSGTQLGDVEYRRALWEGGAQAVAGSDDPFIRLARAVDGEARRVRSAHEQRVELVERENQTRIARVRFETLGTDTYPDATFTLRLSYGKVRGWEERGRRIPPFTTIAGAFERHTGNDPYALPDSWLNARSRLNLRQPMNFVSTHDIIGGNSGSPVINRNAEVVGLVFDGNIHALGGNYWYDERMNRAVSVHSGFIIEALRRVYDARELLRELGQR